MTLKPLVAAVATGLILLIGAMAGFIFGRTTIPESPAPPLEEPRIASPLPTTPASDGLTEPTDEPVFCTMDAKECPDGSYVGRVGPNCEFAPCPGE